MTEIAYREHDYEPERGLPETLPDDEYILWQGAPSGSRVARRIMKTRWVGVYFAVLALWAVVAGHYDGRTIASIAFSAGVLVLMGAIVLAMLELYAWGVQKTTVYTVTNARVVMRIGVGLTVTLNIPYAQIENVALRREKDGSGTIAMSVREPVRMNWLVIWPHTRAWRFTRPEPALICLAEVDRVAALIIDELKARTGDAQPRLAAAAQPAPKPAGKPKAAATANDAAAATA